MNEEEQDIVIYETSDGDTRLSVKLNGDTVWLSLNQMSVLFGRDKRSYLNEGNRLPRIRVNWNS